MRALLVCLLVVGSVALGNTKVLQNDTFTGGAVFAGLSFGEYQGAAVLFEPDADEYPLMIVGVDVLAVPYLQQGQGAGDYELDLWDESGGTVAPPRPSDGGTRYLGRVDRQGVRLTTSTALFNRYLLAVPLVVLSGKIFVKVSQQRETAVDNTTIALDTALVPKPNANWFFDGLGRFQPFEQADGGFNRGLHRNWIIRLVLEVPESAVTVRTINPSMGDAAQETSVVITGTNFEVGARAFLGTQELVVGALSGTSMTASVPAGLAPGRYDLRVKNTLGAAGVLYQSFTVLAVDAGAPADPLTMSTVAPSRMTVNETTNLLVAGTGFAPGAQLFVGDTAVDNVVVESPELLSATLAPHGLAVGLYDVSVVNVSGERATLPRAFAVEPLRPSGCGCSSGLGFALGVLVLLLRRGRTSPSPCEAGRGPG